VRGLVTLLAIYCTPSVLKKLTSFMVIFELNIGVLGLITLLAIYCTHSVLKNLMSFMVIFELNIGNINYQ
jgi:hypothetical protein